MDAVVPDEAAQELSEGPVFLPASRKSGIFQEIRLSPKDDLVTIVRAILESPLQIESVRRKKGRPFRGGPGA